MDKDPNNEVVETEIKSTEEIKVVEEQPEENLEVKKDAEETEVNDSVKEAMELNKKMKEELEELKSRNSNVFEENAVLKAELETQQQLTELANENAKIKSQLEGIKRNGLIDGMIATGKLNDKLKDWANGLTIEQLEILNLNAPKVKTILDEENSKPDANEEFEQWHKEISKSRIIQ